MRLFGSPMPVRKTFLLVLLLTISVTAHAAPKYKVLHSFNGTDGSGPYGGVTVGPDRGIYGTTAGGGPCGTVFELKEQQDGAWAETVLYQFAKTGDGCDPWSSVAFDSYGNLYGATVGGGDDYCDGGCGTIFELQHGVSFQSTWTENVIFEFDYKDGASPTSGVIVGSSGTLYGTAPGAGPYGGGVAFRLKRDSGEWHETALHDFHLSYYGHSAPGGSGPVARPVMDAEGNLYGTTVEGGTSCEQGCGTVYELTSIAGGHWKETVLHTFRHNGKDGITPGLYSLYIDSAKNLYGTTAGGGCCGGIVFKLIPWPNGEWTEDILYEFQQNASGYLPNAGVVMDKNGNLYGTTDAGGEDDCGVIYKLAPKPKGKWSYSVLHVFNGADGCVPEANLILDDKGNLYGGTILGGAHGVGVIFEYSTMLSAH
jgi:uncharacterized repeat protein (TIGR03803 family)